MDRIREIALKTLYKIDKEKAYSNLALDEQIRENRRFLENRDIGLISELVYGVTTWRLTIDEILKKYSKIRLKKISIWILNILRMGIYQIIFLEKIPKSAAVNESVSLAKRYGHHSSSNFVNAILRKVEKKDYDQLFEIKNDEERISKTTSMPEWIVKRLLDKNKIEEVQKICEALNEKPQMTIRINTLKINKEQLEQQLKENNIEFEETDLEDFIVIKKVKNIEKLDLFQEGYFTIQDKSAGLTSIILSPKENEIVLDACSAPGGKTTHLAQIMNNKGKIIAWDIYKHRLNLVEENSKRLGIGIIKTENQNATEMKEEYIETFDKILLDVPCLGIGVIKRKPDIKWQRKEDDITEITKIQLRILQVCSRYLKNGGDIVYSTCSILEDENDSIIDKFLEENKNFKVVNKKKIFPSKSQDGFYICKMKKILH